MKQNSPTNCAKRTKTKHAPCPTCHGEVIGRSDKRFCSLKCKNEHHRIARIQLKPHIKEAQRKLVRNLIVMEGILGPANSCMAIHKDLLFEHGFDMHACSSVIVVNERNYQQLGDYTYRIEKNGMILVKRNKSLSSHHPQFFARWKIDFPEGIEVKNVGDLFEGDKEFSEFCRWNE